MIMDFNFSFLFSTPKHVITKENIFSTFKLEPKRICFRTVHKSALKKTGFKSGPPNALYIPFKNTIKMIFDSCTGLNICQIKSGKYWCPANNDKELIKIKYFIEQYNNIVFLRDELEISCAICEYCFFEDGIQHCTEIGSLEKIAKAEGNKDAIDTLSKNVIKFVINTPYYKDANYICGIPSSKNLPATIAELVAQDILELTNISNNIRFKNEKSEVKNKKDINERWDILEAAELQVKVNIKKKKIILLDDMYQTGITMQYIAMKLLEEGAASVYGLSLVKSASNSL